MSLVTEMVGGGCRQGPACELLGISERTYQRWASQRRTTGSSHDGRPGAVRPEPANKLSPEERERIVRVASSPEFADSTPLEIVPALADRGEYIGSESTFYRVLRENGMMRHRGRAARPTHREKPAHTATGPNQVWSWDITYIPGPIRGIFFYLYMIIDIFSRKIVGWEVWDVESAEHASELIARATIAEGRTTTQPLVLHSDNGSPMKGATMLVTLQKLGITPSNSRPRVSNDNAFSERLFGTLKYRPDYVPDGFATIMEAREWCRRFVSWYNTEHHHAGIKFLTPQQRHSGEEGAVVKSRHELYEKAKALHPERWNGRSTRDWEPPTVVHLNAKDTSGSGKARSA